MKAKTFLLGLTVGLIGGAATVLSTTPQSGEQLRQNLIRNTTTAKINLLSMKSETANVIQSINALTNEVKNNIPQTINQLKEAVGNFKQEIEPDTLRLKQEIEKLQKSIDEIEKNIPQANKTEK